MTTKADYIAARASESLSYGDLAYAQEQGWCGSSPDGMGPHRPDDTADPVTCAECGAEIEPGDEYDDGKVLIAGVLYDAETGWEADEDGPPPDLNREGDPTLNGAFG